MCEVSVDEQRTQTDKQNVDERERYEGDCSDVSRHVSDVVTQSSSGDETGWIDLIEWDVSEEGTEGSENDVNKERCYTGENERVGSVETGDHDSVATEVEEKEEEKNNEEEEAVDYSGEEDDKETLNLKQAVFNYTLSYDVDEDENNTILARLKRTYNEDETSDKTSDSSIMSVGLLDTNSSSEEDFDHGSFTERLNKASVNIQLRRVSMSDLQSKYLVSPLPAIKEGSQKNSLTTTSSSPISIIQVDSNNKRSSISAIHNTEEPTFGMLELQQPNGMEDSVSTRHRDNAENEENSECDIGSSDKLSPPLKIGKEGVDLRTICKSPSLVRRRLSLGHVLNTLAPQPCSSPPYSCIENSSSSQIEPNNVNSTNFDTTKKVSTSLPKEEEPQRDNRETSTDCAGTQSLIVVLKERVEATLSRRNSIASTKPWTGTLEMSMKESINLHDNNKDKDNSQGVNGSLSDDYNSQDVWKHPQESCGLPPKMEQEKSSTPIAESFKTLENIKSNNKLVLQQTTTLRDANFTNTPAKSSPENHKKGLTPTNAVVSAATSSIIFNELGSNQEKSPVVKREVEESLKMPKKTRNRKNPIIFQPEEKSQTDLQSVQKSTKSGREVNTSPKVHKKVLDRPNSPVVKQVLEKTPSPKSPKPRHRMSSPNIKLTKKEEIDGNKSPVRKATPESSPNVSRNLQVSPNSQGKRKQIERLPKALPEAQNGQQSVSTKGKQKERKESLKHVNGRRLLDTKNMVVNSPNVSETFERSQSSPITQKTQSSDSPRQAQSHSKSAQPSKKIIEQAPKSKTGRNAAGMEKRDVVSNNSNRDLGYQELSNATKIEGPEKSSDKVQEASFEIPCMVEDRKSDEFNEEHDAAVRKSSVNVIRRPRSPFSISIGGPIDKEKGKLSGTLTQKKTLQSSQASPFQKTKQEAQVHSTPKKKMQTNGISLVDPTKQQAGTLSNNDETNNQILTTDELQKDNQADMSTIRASEQSMGKVSVESPKGELEADLEAFSSMLGEFEVSSTSTEANGEKSSLSSLSVTTQQIPRTNTSPNSNEDGSPNSKESVPTDKRFAALSKRYAAIMAKFGSTDGVTEGNKKETKTGDRNLDGAMALNSEREMSDTFERYGKNTISPSNENANSTQTITKNVETGIVDSSEDLLKTKPNYTQRLASPIRLNNSSQKANAIQNSNDTEEPVSVITVPSSDKNSPFTVCSTDVVIPPFQIHTAVGHNVKITQMTTLKSAAVAETRRAETTYSATFAGIDAKEVKMVPIEVTTSNFDVLSRRQESLQNAKKIMTGKDKSDPPKISRKEVSEIAMKSSNQLSTSTEVPTNISYETATKKHSVSLVSKPHRADENDLVLPTSRTTVVANLMHRKMGPRGKYSTVSTLAKRKSKVFNDVEARMVDVPESMTEFNRYRNYIEKVTLKSTVKTEALSIRELLHGLNSQLLEMELVSICKESTKTLRTLDALGSLPTYLALDTVIINPSGTIKFKHLSTGTTVDDLYLPPESTNRFSSEKHQAYPVSVKAILQLLYSCARLFETCVFNLAVTLWLAADWKLTEAQKPSLTSCFQELLVSMTEDVSTVRANFDIVLRTCESLYTEGEMTSRERCQALLWEYQASSVLNNNEAGKKSADDLKRKKAQHNTLMGSVSVAGNIKGFLKKTEAPKEQNIFAKPQQDHVTKDEANIVESRKTPKSRSKKRGINSSFENSIEQANIKTDILKPSSPDIASSPSKNSPRQDFVDRKDQGNSKPSPSSNMFHQYKHATDPQMMFTPITQASGSTMMGMRSGSAGADRLVYQGTSPVPTQTFFPIAVPLSAVGPSAMWYMTPSGMIPYPQAGHHAGYFMPVEPPPGSEGEASEVSEIDSRVPESKVSISRPSTPQSGVSDRQGSKQRKLPSPHIKSKIPRPVWESKRHRSNTTLVNVEDDSHAVRTISSHRGSFRAQTPPPSFERSPGNVSTSTPRSQTSPVRWRADIEGMDENDGGRRPSRRAATLSSRSSSLSGLSRSAASGSSSSPSSPSIHGNMTRSSGSRAGSPVSCGSRSGEGSRPSSPVNSNSRPSSPVLALISRFEELSSEPTSGEHSKAVSSLLTKFGSSSLLSEDRLAKRHFKPKTSPNRVSNTSRTGPLRPASAMEQNTNELPIDDVNLSKSWSTNPNYFAVDEGSSYNSDDSIVSSSEGLHRDIHRTGSDPGKKRARFDENPLSEEVRNRLSSSLNNIYGRSEDRNGQGMQHSYSDPYSVWSPLEHSHERSDSDFSLLRYSGQIRKSSSIENLVIQDGKDLYSNSFSQREVSSVRTRGSSTSNENVNLPNEYDLRSQYTHRNSNVLNGNVDNYNYRDDGSSNSKTHRNDIVSRERTTHQSKENTQVRSNEQNERRPVKRNPMDNYKSSSHQNDAISDRISIKEYSEVLDKRAEREVKGKYWSDVEPVRENLWKGPYITPERNRSKDYTKDFPSPPTVDRLEVPVNIAVMDTKLEEISALRSEDRRGSGPFSPSLFSPTSVKGSIFSFHHPVKLEKDSAAPSSSPAPLSSSMKECKPSSYFSNVSFSKNNNMQPERDTSSMQSSKREQKPLEEDLLSMRHQARRSSEEAEFSITGFSNSNVSNSRSRGATNDDSNRTGRHSARTSLGGAVSGSSDSSVGHNQDYLERFRRRLSRSSSASSDGDTDLSEERKGFNSDSSNTNISGTNRIGINVGKIEEVTPIPIKPRPRYLPLSVNTANYSTALNTFSSPTDSTSARLSLNSPSPTEKKGRKLGPGDRGKVSKSGQSPSSTAADPRSSLVSHPEKKGYNESSVTEAKGSSYSHRQKGSKGYLASSTNNNRHSGQEGTNDNPSKGSHRKKPASLPTTPTNTVQGNPPRFSYPRRQSTSVIIGTGAKSTSSSYPRGTSVSNPTSPGNYSKESSTNTDDKQSGFVGSQKSPPVPKSPMRAPDSPLFSRFKQQIADRRRSMSSSVAALKSPNSNKRLLAASRSSEPASMDRNRFDFSARGIQENNSVYSYGLKDHNELGLRSPIHTPQMGKGVSSSADDMKSKGGTEFTNDSGMTLRTSFPDGCEFKKSPAEGSLSTTDSTNPIAKTSPENIKTSANLSTVYAEASGPTSPSLSSSSSSSPSPRLPLDQFLFYTPQQEITTDNIQSLSNQKGVNNKGFVITDTSRQSQEKKVDTPSKAIEGASKSKKNISEEIRHKQEENNEQYHKEGSMGRRFSSETSLNAILKAARRSSLTPRNDSDRSTSSQDRSCSPSAFPDGGRPLSALSKRSPSPARVDSKELLGHLVKKVLTSAAAKKSGGSPNSSFVDSNVIESKYLTNGSSQPKTVLHTSEIERSEEKRNNERKSYVEKKQWRESEERKPNSNDRQLNDSHVLDQCETVNSARNVESEITEPIQEKIGMEVTPAALASEPEISGATGTTRTLRRSKDREHDVSGESEVLAKLVDMIHEEFALDGYLDDGVEDVNMAEYIMSLSGMSEEMFKEAISDQYSDLYWDDDLLQEMYLVVTKGLMTPRPTLKFSESTVSDLSRPESSLSLSPGGSTCDIGSLYLSSVSRSSSERSSVETRDYLMSSLGEPAEFLPFRIIAPDITRDIIDEVAPIFEDYYRVMKVKLSPSITELTEKLGAKILEIGQQLTLERRAKRKNVTSFNKVADVENKKDLKDLATILLQEIEESDKKIIYLKYIQRRLRNIYAERFGLDHSLLHSFANSYGVGNVTLEPTRQNSLLSFSPLWDQRGAELSEAHGESTKGPVLQYGSKDGLFSYLFGRHGMSQAYVRYFLYTYRYCATPTEVFAFMKDKCRASLRVDSTSGQSFNYQLQIRYRALDVLAEWIDCSYQFDFKHDPDLLKELVIFIQTELIPVDRTERGNMLIELISERQRKDQEEEAEETPDAVAVLQTDDNQGLSGVWNHTHKLNAKRKGKSPAQCFKRGSPQMSSVYKPTVYLKAMSVIDHSSRTIAEQLTLIQQDMFTRAHPIHLLNSRFLGVGVGRSSPTKEASSQLDSMLGFSAGRRRSIAVDSLNMDDLSSSGREHNMFIGLPNTDGCLEAMLGHAQDVSMWVAVEICSAPSVKSQLVLITKFISVAKYCAEMRNFATCVQVVDALEMFVIRQLPVWKQVPSKITQTQEELRAIKVLLKTDSAWLLRDSAYREKPTIPCTLLFLMHIQQLELGGFTLANGMFKWTKMRSIGRLVDQVRLFKQMRYAFEANDSLKDRLSQRIQECREENLHALASENAANFHLSSSQSSRKFQDAFKKMKTTFGHG